MALIPAPGGWGWRPGTNLGEVELDDLPEFPLLNQLASQAEKIRLLRQEAHRFPHGTKATHLQHRYGIAYATAWDIVHGVKRTGRHPRNKSAPGSGLTHTAPHGRG